MKLVIGITAVGLAVLSILLFGWVLARSSAKRDAQRRRRLGLTARNEDRAA